jgi:uncharacterized membrane protein
MTFELAAVVFDGDATAAQRLESLRDAGEPWVAEVAVVERHRSGRYTVRATSPDYGEADRTRSGIAIGGATGAFLAILGGPAGVVALGALGAVAGAAFGEPDRMGQFDPLVRRVEEALPRHASALLLVAERPVAERFAAAASEGSSDVLREELTQEQLEQLSRA